MAQDDEKLGFIEEALRHRQVTPADAEPDPDGDPDLGGQDLDEEPEAAEPPAAEEPEAEPESEAAEPEAAEPEATEPVPAPVGLPFDSWPVDDRALVDEALKKAGLVWVRTAEHRSGRAYWHVWVDERVYLLTGPGEQPAEDLAAGTSTSVVVPSKDTTARLLTFGAAVSDVRPDDEDWDAATAALAGSRLNLPDPAGAPQRWAADPRVRILRLTPSDPAGERPAAYDDRVGRIRPRPSPATTAGRPPRVVHRRHGSGRPLS